MLRSQITDLDLQSVLRHRRPSQQHREALPEGGVVAGHRPRLPGWRFNRNNLGLSFGLKNGLRFHFDSVRGLNYPFLNTFFIKVGNLKPKLKWFFKPNIFILNCHPGLLRVAAAVALRRRRVRLGARGGDRGRRGGRGAPDAAQAALRRLARPAH